MSDAASASTAKEFVDRFSKKALLKTSVDAYIRRFASIETATGKLQSANAASGFRPAGYFADEARGLPEYKTGDGTIKWVSHGEKVLKGLTVAGLTSVAQEGSPVWATDNQTLTMTPQVDALPAGYVHEFVESGVGDIYFYSSNEIVQRGMVIDSIFMTRVESMQLEATDKLLLAKYKSNFKGFLMKASAVAVHLDSGVSAGAQDISFEIGATPTVVTGGVISLAFGDTLGLRKAGTAITANNAVLYGEEIALYLDAGGTGFTGSKRRIYDVFIDVLRGA